MLWGAFSRVSLAYFWLLIVFSKFLFSSSLIAIFISSSSIRQLSYFIASPSFQFIPFLRLSLSIPICFFFIFSIVSANVKFYFKYSEHLFLNIYISRWFFLSFI